MQPMNTVEKILYKLYTREFDSKSHGIHYTSDEMFLLEQKLFFKYFGRKKRPGETERVTGERENLAARSYELTRKQTAVIELESTKRYKAWQKKTAEDITKLETDIQRIKQQYM